MDADFWQRAWTEDRTGFHQTRVNKRLEAFWSHTGVADRAPVFVPLCGKSLDMLWLHERGHPVFGIELSEKAVAAFFEENGLAHSVVRSALGVEYVGSGAAQGVRLVAGDFFSLTPAALAHVGGIYDRASLIAMDDALRANYASQLGRIVPAGACGLLLAIDYDRTRMNGPPFALTDSMVQALLGEDFAIDELECYSGPERLGNLKNRGLDTLTERVYRLQRRANAAVMARSGTNRSPS